MSSGNTQDAPEESIVDAQHDKELMLAEMDEAKETCQAVKSKVAQRLAKPFLKLLEKNPRYQEIITQSLGLGLVEVIPDNGKSVEAGQSFDGLTQSEEEAELVQLFLRVLRQDPGAQKIIAQSLATTVARENVIAANITTEPIDQEFIYQRGSPQLIKDFSEARTDNDKLASENSQLYTVLGHMVCQPDFFDDKSGLLIAECHWPFTSDDVRVAAAEWIRSNDFIPPGQASRFPEAAAVHMWLLSVTTTDLLDYQALTDWMRSAQHHFQDVGSLKFLITTLWNLLLNPKLSADHTWVAVRLLEFFVILDKDGILDKV